MAHLNAAWSDVSHQPNKCKMDRLFCNKPEMDEPAKKHLGNQLDRIKLLYPMVNETETPLPRQWGSKKAEKFSTLGLTHNDLRVFYKGSGKDHNDAASIRTSHHIPSSCGIYYFEVKIISKGRDGYMGIGLTAVHKMENRLPGWDKNSYGYHGDDGNSFCSSGIGQPYGPTFTTGDVIGCCINFIDNTCFYTKNGFNLGIAFRELPSTLYPTVGLQTPGEVVEANFGQTAFVFDFEDYTKEWHQKIKSRIDNFVGPSKMNLSLELPRLVISYLARQGYSSTAQGFAQSSGQKLEEDISAIRNRQKIQQMVLGGRISEAIGLTQSLYPGLLNKESNLLFQLKCRQFIEMVNGVDDDYSASPSHPQHVSSPRLMSPFDGNKSTVPVSNGTSRSETNFNTLTNLLNTSFEGTTTTTITTTNGHSIADVNDEDDGDEVEMDTTELNSDGVDEFTTSLSNGDSPFIHNHNADNHLLTDAQHSPRDKNHHFSNRCARNDGDILMSSPSHSDGLSKSDTHTREKKSVSIERLLRFGRDLHLMGEQLKKEKGRNEDNEKALKDAFSLLAYADPWNSPVGYQLDPLQRESISKILNRAILEEIGLSKQSPLEVAISQASLCLKLMSRAGIGSCAFASLSSLFS